MSRVDNATPPAPPETIAAAICNQVGPQLVELRKMVEAVETAQATLREGVSKLSAAEEPATAADLLMLGTEIGKLNTRVRVIERDLRAFGEGVAEALGGEDGE